MRRARSDEDKERRRRALLEAALEEFFERGWAAARMEDVAKRATLSKGSVYLYFESKEALFAALIDRVARPNLERVEAVVAAAPSARAAIESLAALAPQIVRRTPAPKLLKILLGDAPAFPAIVRSYRAEVVERLLRALTGLLQAAHDRGELWIPEPALTARLLAAPILFSATWRVLFETPEALAEGELPQDLEGFFAEHARLMLRALAPEEGAERGAGEGEDDAE